MNRIFFILWPAFIAAGLAEVAFFTLIDPQELYLFGEPVHYSKTATYSLGFLGFWAACIASSTMTYFLQRPAAEVNRVEKQLTE
jgi:hypothetical protein